jgi:SAM-dependent methyltransferase
VRVHNGQSLILALEITTLQRIRKIAYRIYWFLEKLIAPSLRDSQYLYKELLESYVPHGGRWLELGCGHQILPGWIRLARPTERALVSRTRLTVGIDPDLWNIFRHPTIRHRIVAAIEHCPFQNESFEFISANMVMEHLQDPIAALSEACRVMKTGGTLVFHTPNLWNYQTLLASLIPQSIKNRLVRVLEGRSDKDVFPATYRINTVPEIEQCAAQCGFQVVDIKVVNSTAATAIVFPLAIFELVAIRLLELRRLQNYRTNIITVLRKQEQQKCFRQEPPSRTQFRTS